MKVENSGGVLTGRHVMEMGSEDSRQRDNSTWVPHPALAVVNSPACAAAGTLFMRVLTAVMIVHHGLDKIENTDGFANGVIATYFPFLPGPYFWTYFAASVELIGSACLALGAFARPAAFMLAGTMMVANLFHLMKFGLQSFPLNPPTGGAYTFEPALLIFGVTIYFACAGPGRFALRPHGF